VRIRKFLSAAGATVFMCAAAAPAAVISIGSIKDNTLYEDAAGSLSNGAGQRIFAGMAGNGLIRRGLMAFDIAGNIPAGATINTVTLRLNMSQTSSGMKTVELRPALIDWGEGFSVAGGGEGSGAPATLGDATWLHARYPSSFWSNVGGDFAGSASASQLVGAIGAYTWSSSQLAGDVQTWLDNPASNFGWAVLCDEVNIGSAKRFDSRENATPANRPLLIIDYSPIPEPATIAILALGILAICRRRCV